jgi:hypothetical protein
LNNFHTIRRPLSYFNPERDEEDRLSRGCAPRQAISLSDCFTITLMDEVEKGNSVGVIELIRLGADVKAFKHSGWSLEEYAYLKGWTRLVETIQRNPACMDRPRSVVCELGNVVESCVDTKFRPDLVFHASAGSANAKKIYAHYGILLQTAPSILTEYNLTHEIGTVSASAVPMDLDFSIEPIEIHIKEDSHVFGALLEWAYTGVIKDTTFTSLQEKQLLPELRGAAFHFKLPNLSQACVRWLKHQLPIFTPAPGSASSCESRRFNSILCPYVNENASCSEIKQLKACLLSRPDRVLVAENRPIFVHSALLMAATDYFGPLFSFSSSKTRVEMRDTSYDALWNVVSYIYTGELGPNLSMATVLELKQFSLEIMLPQMKPLCDAAFLKTGVTKETALDFLDAAIEANQAELETKCLQFVGSHLIDYVTKEKDRFKTLLEPRLSQIYSFMEPSHVSIIKRNLSIYLS